MSKDHAQDSTELTRMPYSSLPRTPNVNPLYPSHTHGPHHATAAGCSFTLNPVPVLQPHCGSHLESLDSKRFLSVTQKLIQYQTHNESGVALTAHPRCIGWLHCSLTLNTQHAHFILCVPSCHWPLLPETSWLKSILCYELPYFYYLYIIFYS